MKSSMRSSRARHIDFGALVGAIPSNPQALPSDIDMIMERHGFFLIGEWKAAGDKVSLGQGILLESLAKQSNFLVILIRGYTEKGDMFVSSVEKVEPDGELSPLGTSLSDLKDIINVWYNWANRRGVN